MTGNESSVAFEAQLARAKDLQNALAVQSVQKADEVDHWKGRKEHYEGLYTQEVQKTESLETELAAIKASKAYRLAVIPRRIIEWVRKK